MWQPRHIAKLSAVQPVPLDHPSLIQSAQIWMTEDPQRSRTINVYTDREGVFDPDAERPERFVHRESGYEALARAIIGVEKLREFEDQKTIGKERSYTHIKGRIEGSGPDTSILIDRLKENLVRASHVAGRIQPKEGWFPDKT
jgi:hypothetical protein